MTQAFVLTFCCLINLILYFSLYTFRYFTQGSMHKSMSDNSHCPIIDDLRYACIVIYSYVLCSYTPDLLVRDPFLVWVEGHHWRHHIASSLHHPLLVLSCPHRRIGI